MISTENIFYALKEVINRAAPELFVTAEPLADSSESYAHISFRPIKKDFGYGLISRSIRVDISVVLSPNLAEAPRADLYNIADKFDVAFCGYVQVLDRFITMYETNSRIFDSILHYEFLLEFSDYVEEIEQAKTQGYEPMQELHIRKDARQDALSP